MTLPLNKFQYNKSKLSSAQFFKKVQNSKAYTYIYRFKAFDKTKKIGLHKL
jgi:hypothetical protein